MDKIPFNKPYLTGNEKNNLESILNFKHFACNGQFAQKCEQFFEQKYNFNKAILTTSCTSALEICAILLNISQNDEIIIPSYTYVSTANAFEKQGAKIVFADSKKDSPNIDENEIEKLITNKTKAIVVVHYAGIAVDMHKILKIAKTYNLFVIEDAAHSINSYFKEKALGSFGNLATFSFHETKNIQCGEGGMLVINDKTLENRAEIVSMNGTNKSAFIKGNVAKYEWVDIGSTFLPNEITAAFLLAQLEQIDIIQQKRIEIWDNYYNNLQILANNNKIILPKINENETNNAHIFYFFCKNKDERNELIKHLKINNIQSSFHYSSLHKSIYFKNKYANIISLPNAEHIEDTLIRLPLFFELTNSEINYITEKIIDFFDYK